jgi:hypothetical protein
MATCGPRTRSCRCVPLRNAPAEVAKLADAPDLGSGSARSRGSSPLLGSSSERQPANGSSRRKPCRRKSLTRSLFPPMARSRRCKFAVGPGADRPESANAQFAAGRHRSLRREKVARRMKGKTCLTGQNLLHKKRCLLRPDRACDGHGELRSSRNSIHHPASP